MIEAKVVEDSMSPAGKRLTTLQLRYPRFIHAEFMTHRMFSRNASSSRAIPVAKVLEAVRNEPAFFEHVGANQPGMQAHEEVSPEVRAQFEQEWCSFGRSAAYWAERWMEAGIHKQVVNRVLEPWQHISVVVTATEWDNFFALRDHPDAQPEMQALARVMKEAMSVSTPVERFDGSNSFDSGSWHLPYVKAGERSMFSGLHLAKISAARCARVSYLTHDGGIPDMGKDLELYWRLVGSDPMHASPVEHQAIPLPRAGGASNNFRGWQQFRDILQLTKEKTTA